MVPAQKAKARASSRRPIEDWETPYLEALGAALKTARLAAGLSRAGMARGAEVSEETIYRIEAGLRRTRLSTLERIAVFLYEESSEDPWRMTDHFASVAGPSLAPESVFPERVERRRARRERKGSERAYQDWKDYARNKDARRIQRTALNVKRFP
jgi:transcriptional regulator with XRE-family HTH domain